MKENLIITSCNAKHADFVLNHWLKSLQNSIDTSDVDIAVICYDLASEAVNNFEQSGVIVSECKSDEKRINIIRRKDTVEFLRLHKYENVIVSDGGDIIFQDDIIHLLNIEPAKIKCVTEEYGARFEDFFIRDSFREDKEEIKKLLNKEKMINAGLLAGKSKIMQFVFEKALDLLVNFNGFGRDQISINYILRKYNLAHEIDETYNFIPTSSRSRFFIKDGVFFTDKNKKIAVVHNAGRKDSFRAIKNFGYGTSMNENKPLTTNFMRILYKILSISSFGLIKFKGGHKGIT
jgi:hypothetical protein